MSLVQPAQFIGKYGISKNPVNIGYIQEIIDMYEPKYMGKLLGAELYNIFDPLFPPFDVINLPFVKDSDPTFCGHSELLVSLGIDKKLLGFIYWEYHNTNGVAGSLTGQVQQIGENSTKPQDVNLNANVYNESVRTFRAIQMFIEQNKVDYPLYKGTCLKLMNWF